MDEIMNNEVIEMEEEETVMTVPETEDTALIDQNENSGMGALAIGVGVIGLAAVGAVTIGRATWKHVFKPIGQKVKDAFSKGKEAATKTVEVECEIVDDDADSEEE